MSDLIETALADRLRIDKWTREELRILIADEGNLRRFSRRISGLLKSTTDNDPHLLEDFYILGLATRDVVRGPFPLDLEDVTMPIVAFVYGFTQEPFENVFKKGGLSEVRGHLFDNVPAKQEIARKAKASLGTGSALPLRSGISGVTFVTLPYVRAAG